MKSDFKNRIVVLGAGAVSQCVMPLLIEYFGHAKQLTIIDQRDHRDRLQEALKHGAMYIQKQLTKDNLFSVLSNYLSAGDVLLDLAWSIDTCALINWAHEKGVLYLNTSLELWDEGGDEFTKPPTERTLYYRHMKLRALKASWKSIGPTAIIEHGANPGMVSHLAKQGLVDIAKRAIKEKMGSKLIETYLENKDFARLSQALQVKVIHISERDTQITHKPRHENEFVNTWSVEGFYEEGTAPAEMGWGTHEKKLPKFAYTHKTGPQNQICLAQPGVKTWVRSWVPGGEMIGMVIRHGEAFTLSDHLTVWEGESAVYRPTVHYAYCPTDAAIASVKELEMHQWQLMKNRRILNEDILEGEDRLGVLLMGHCFKSWWIGSLLSIQESRKFIPHQSATTVQVAAGVFAALAWAIDNPNKGLLVPDDMPYDEVLPYAEKYWGGYHSQPVDWDPISTKVDLFKGWHGAQKDESDPWQFEHFVV